MQRWEAREMQEQTASVVVRLPTPERRPEADAEAEGIAVRRSRPRSPGGTYYICDVLTNDIPEDLKYCWCQAPPESWLTKSSCKCKCHLDRNTRNYYER